MCVSAIFTTGIPQSTSIDKRDLQEDLNNFEIAVSTLLTSRLDSSTKGQPKVIDHSLETKILDKNVHQNEELIERLKVPRPEIPTVIDLAFPTQKQRFKNRNYVSKISSEPFKGESKEHERQGEPKQSLLGTNKDCVTQMEQKYSSEKKRIVKPGKDKIQSRKKDFKVLMHEFRRMNSTALKDLAIPDAIDLAFTKGHRNSPTRATTLKPTTLYWPPTSKYKMLNSKRLAHQWYMGDLMHMNLYMVMFREPVFL